jgi:hypothetical protein
MRPNYRMQQTVRPVTSIAGQRPRQAIPQLTRRRWDTFSKERERQRNRSFMMTRPLLCLRTIVPCLLILLALPALGQVSPESTQVVILGVNHSAELLAESQRPALFRAFFDRVNPTAIAVERDPQSFARNDFYEFTYEVQHIVLPWAKERRLPIDPIDWVPPTEDQRLLFGLDLEAAPFLRPAQGFGGFLSFSDSSTLSQSLFFAEEEGEVNRNLSWADGAAEDASYDAARRLFLYRTFLQARRVLQAASNYRGGTLLVVIGSMHKPDLERIMSSYPGIKIVQPSHYGLPTEEEAGANERLEDGCAVASFNLLGVQAHTGVVDYAYVRRVIERLEKAGGVTPEVRLFRTRLGVLTGQVRPQEAADQYRQIREAVKPDARFTWTGVKDRFRLDSFFDPFGNLTVGQRAALEEARELNKLDRGEEADALREELAAMLSPQKAAQLQGYWDEHVRNAR